MDVYSAIELASLLVLPGFILLDQLRPARRFERPRFWRLRAAAVSALAFGLSIAVTTGWGVLCEGVHLLDLSGLGALAGAGVGIVSYQLVHYGYHRLVHGWDPLWKHSHQMHHSAESLDALGAYYLHPLDVFFFTTWSSLVLFPVLGLSLQAGVLAGGFMAFNASFQHANIRTPRWVGWFVQRPEMHGLHHQRGLHRYNYADLPLVDMLFGTYRNPHTWEGELGFWNGASARLGALLLGRDVSTPPAPEADSTEPTRQLSQAA